MKWLRSKDQYLSLIISDPESSSQSTGEHRRLSLSGSSHFLHHAAAPHHTHSSFHSTPRRPLRMLPITGVLLGPLLLDIHREAIPQLDHRPHQRWPLPHPQCLVTSFQTSDALHPWLTCSCHASQHWWKPPSPHLLLNLLKCQRLLLLLKQLPIITSFGEVFFSASFDKERNCQYQCEEIASFLEFKSLVFGRKVGNGRESAFILLVQREKK